MPESQYSIVNAISVGEMNSSFVTWNSGTAQNTTAVLVSNDISYNTLNVSLSQTTTITGGVVTFQGSFDGVTFFNMTGVVPGTGALIGPTYTLQANTYATFQFNLTAIPYFQVLLGTAITGTGAVTIGFAADSFVGSNNTPTVNQGTSPWVDNITQWDGVALGAPTAWGTAPSTSPPVNVIGTNAALFASGTALTTVIAGSPGIVCLAVHDPASSGGSGGTQYIDETAESAGAFTITVAGMYNGTQVRGLRADASDNLKVNLQTAIPTGTNVIGHVITDSGSTTAVTQTTSPWIVQDASAESSLTTLAGTVFNTGSPAASCLRVAGDLIHNNAAPATQNVGVLPAVASAGAPTYNANDQVLLSTDLSGNLRVSGNFSNTPTDTIGTLAALGALNNSASVVMAGQQGVGFFLAAGTFVGTIVPELSYDGGTTWIATSFYGPDSQIIVSSIVFGSANTATEKSIITSGGVSNVRVRVSAYTSGTANCTLRATLNTTNEAFYVTGAMSLSPAGGLAMGWDGTNVHALTTDTLGRLTVIVSGNKSNNSVVPGSTNMGVLPGIANAATQTWNEGDQVLESMDLSGRQRIRGTLTNNNAAPAADYIGSLPALCNSSAPTFTNGFQTTLSVDTAGGLRVVGTTADGSTTETSFLVVGGESNDATAQYQPIPLGTTGRSVIIEGFSGGTAVAVDIAGHAGATLDGVITAATAPANGLAILDVYQSSPFVLTAGQSVAIQSDINGNLKVMYGLTFQTLTTWTSANFTGGFTVVLAVNTGCPAVIVQLDQTGTLTTGAVTWQGTYDGINWVTIPAQQVIDPTSPTFSQIGNPYTFVTAVNKPFLIMIGGYQSIRALESTALTGSGSVIPYVTQLAYSPINQSGTVIQGNAGTNAQSWWVQIGDALTGPVEVQPGIGTATVPPTFTTAGADNSDPALTVIMSPNSGIPAIVQKTSGTGSGSQSSLATSNFVSNVTAGNSIVVVVGVGNNNGAISVTDTLGNSYTTALIQANVAAVFQLAIFYATNIKGGTNAVTVNSTGTLSSLCIAAYEVSGIIGVGGGGSPALGPSTINQQGSVDVTASGSGSSVTPASGAATIQFPNEIAFGGIALGTANQTPTAFTPWNKDFDLVVGGTPSGLFGLHTFSQPLGAASVSVSLTATITSEPWATAIITFKPVLQAIGGVVTIGAPATVAGVYNTTIPTPAAGASVPLQQDSTGNLYINAEGRKATYRFGFQTVPLSSSAQPCFTIQGSASKTIRVTQLRFSMFVTTGSSTPARVSLQRFSSFTGGTSSTLNSPGRLDTNDSSFATATAVLWSPLPTSSVVVGSPVDAFDYQLTTVSATTAPAPVPYLVLFGSQPGTKEFVLRGLSDYLGLIINGTGTTPLASIMIEWTEE
jgi:hypothetical protein